VSTHRLVIDNWHPATLNQLLAGRWHAYKLKKADKKLLGFCLLESPIPKARGKRRVSLEITLAPRQRAADPDAYWKSLLDALKSHGLVRDDSRTWCELGGVTFARGERKSTTIVLEDVSDASDLP
jgi:hypothetical protein